MSFSYFYILLETVLGNIKTDRKTDIINYLLPLNIKFMITIFSGIFREEPGVKLGDWERGARYMTSILEVK